MKPGSLPDLRRRRVLGGTLFGSLASLLLGRSSLAQVPPAPGASDPHPAHGTGHGGHHGAEHGAMMTVGDVDHARNGFDPHDLLTAWDTGTVSMLPDGRRLREFTVTAVEHEVLDVIGIEKLLAVERATVEKGKA